MEHAFSTARGDVGRDRFGRGFGFEIVQPVALEDRPADAHHARLQLIHGEGAGLGRETSRNEQEKRCYTGEKSAKHG